jgi:hypothetical protein
MTVKEGVGLLGRVRLLTDALLGEKDAELHLCHLREPIPGNREATHCPICEDERQYVNPTGQAWTTVAELQGKRLFSEGNLKRLKLIDSKTTRGHYCYFPTASVVMGARALNNDQS